jgi:hypothetical protein
LGSVPTGLRAVRVNVRDRQPKEISRKQEACDLPSPIAQELRKADRSAHDIEKIGVFVTLEEYGRAFGQIDRRGDLANLPEFFIGEHSADRLVANWTGLTREVMRCRCAIHRYPLCASKYG